MRCLHLCVHMRDVHNTRLLSGVQGYALVSRLATWLWHLQGCGGTATWPPYYEELEQESHRAHRLTE